MREAAAEQYPACRAPDRIDVRKLRRTPNLSQEGFAIKFGFNVSTLRKWEQGSRHPLGTARVLLAVIAHAPEIVDEALAATPPPRSIRI